MARALLSYGTYLPRGKEGGCELRNGRVWKGEGCGSVHVDRIERGERRDVVGEEHPDRLVEEVESEVAQPPQVGGLEHAARREELAQEARVGELRAEVTGEGVRDDQRRARKAGEGGRWQSRREMAISPARSRL